MTHANNETGNGNDNVSAIFCVGEHKSKQKSSVSLKLTAAHARTTKNQIYQNLELAFRIINHFGKSKIENEKHTAFFFSFLNSTMNDERKHNKW